MRDGIEVVGLEDELQMGEGGEGVGGVGEDEKDEQLEGMVIGEVPLFVSALAVWSFVCFNLFEGIVASLCFEFNTL